MKYGQLIGLIALIAIVILITPVAACTPTVTKTGLKEACQNSEINYTVRVDYYNENMVYASKVVDTLPSGVTYVSSSDNGIYNGLSNPKTVTWYYNVPKTGGSKNFYITAIPTATTNSLVNKAQAWVNITTDNLKGKGTWASPSSQVSTSAKVSQCQPTVTITGPPTICSGTDCKEATFDIGFSYSGIAGYYGKVVYELPAGVSYTSSSTGGIYDASSRTVSWEFASMSTAVTKTLQVTINPQGGSSPLVNNVKAYIKQSASVPYSATAFATNQWTTQSVPCTPAVTIAGLPTVCVNCQQTSYDIGFSYSGVAGYYGKVVYELPPGVSFISSPDGTYDSVLKTVSWEFGPMSASETKGPYQVTINPQGGSTPLVNNVNAYIKQSAAASWSAPASATTQWTTQFVPCTPSPEFPSIFLPASMIIGFLGAILYVRKTREN